MRSTADVCNTRTWLWATKRSLHPKFMLSLIFIKFQHINVRYTVRLIRIQWIIHAVFFGTKDYFMVSQATVSTRHKFGLATAVCVCEIDEISTPENFHTWSCITVYSRNQSAPHPFLQFRRAKKIRRGLDSRPWAGFWKKEPLYVP